MRDVVDETEQEILFVSDCDELEDSLLLGSGEFDSDSDRIGDVRKDREDVELVSVIDKDTDGDCDANFDCVCDGERELE